MIHVTRRLTAKYRDQLRNPTLGNRVWATATFLLQRKRWVRVLVWIRSGLGRGPGPRPGFHLIVATVLRQSTSSGGSERMAGRRRRRRLSRSVVRCTSDVVVVSDVNGRPVTAVGRRRVTSSSRDVTSLHLTASAPTTMRIDMRPMRNARHEETAAAAASFAAAASDCSICLSRSLANCLRCRPSLSCFIYATLLHHRIWWLVAWHSGRTSVSGRRTFPVLRSTCS